MREFKFFQKEIRKFSQYEKMVLIMVEYCFLNEIAYTGYSRSFFITEIEDRRIVLTKFTKHQGNIIIDYTIHQTNNHSYSYDSVILTTLEIKEDEFYEIMRMTPSHIGNL